MEQRRQRLIFRSGKDGRRPHAVGDAALDTAHTGQSGVVGDIGRLARPGRERPRARDHQQRGAIVELGRAADDVGEQVVEATVIERREIRSRVDEMHVPRSEVLYGRHGPGQRRKQTLLAKRGKRR